MSTKKNVLDLHPYLRQTLDLIADKWVVAVLYVLSQNTRRYGELQREIGDISQRMLTRTLRDLERNGLVSRKVYLVVPPMVEYSLTPLGKTLNQVLKELCDWSTENFHDVEAARLSHDNSEQNRS
ncbi:MAG: helix-turn-helix transcriptional regulator [Cyanobacteria bacterium RU_5_0]|nr:helix-turn-helix transcriptional regulator [Cyanobacteria bacterium RU_5_0]